MSPLELYDLCLLHAGDAVVRERAGRARRLPLADWTREQRPGADPLVRRCRGAELGGVHPRTSRSRLRRLGELAGLDIDDAVERLVAHRQLHLLGGLR